MKKPKWMDDIRDLYLGIYKAGRDTNLENHVNAARGTANIIWRMKVKPFVNRVLGDGDD